METDIVTVNGPVVGGMIYQVTLPSGMVITNPAGFEVFAERLEHQRSKHELPALLRLRYDG